MPADRKSRGPTAELSRLETEVMDVVWALGQCSSAEVIEAFSKRRTLAPTTLRTVLAKLREKGYVEPVDAVERGFRIQPTVAREVVVRKTLDQLMATLFGGSPSHAIAHLLKAEQIDEQELGRLRRLIDGRLPRKGK